MAQGQKFTVNVYLPDRKFENKHDQAVSVSLDPITETSTSALFSVTIPKHIYDVVSRYGLEYQKREHGFKHIASLSHRARSGEVDQTLKNPSLEALLEDLRKVGGDAMAITELLRMTKGEHASEKFLAVRFSAYDQMQKSAFNHATMGRKLVLSFQYFVVFRAVAEGRLFQKARYAFHSDELDQRHGLLWHGLSQEIPAPGEDDNPTGRVRSDHPGEFAGFRFIPWTQEREDFFAAIEGKISQLNCQLAAFLDNLDAEKVDQIIAENHPLLEFKREE